MSNASRNPTTVSRTLTDHDRDDLRRMLTEHGDIETAATLGVSRTAAYRGAAGLRLYGGTASTIESALQRRRA